MSTPRFPRTKFVRALLRMEMELTSWADTLRRENLARGICVPQQGWDQRATAMWVAAIDVHSLADDMAHLPGAAQRRYARDRRHVETVNRAIAASRHRPQASPEAG